MAKIIHNGIQFSGPITNLLLWDTLGVSSTTHTVKGLHGVLVLEATWIRLINSLKSTPKSGPMLPGSQNESLNHGQGLHIASTSLTLTTDSET